MFWGLRARAFGVDEGSFHVAAQHARAARTVPAHFVRCLDALSNRRPRGGQRSDQKRRDAARCQTLGNRANGFRRALHHIAPEAPMHMEVDHARQRNQVASVHIGRRDAPYLCRVIGFPRDNPSFVHHQRAVPVALSVCHQRATVNPKRHAL